MVRQVGAIVAAMIGLLVGSAGSLASPPASPERVTAERVEPGTDAVTSPKPAPPRPPSVSQALEKGVLIVVSLPTQRIFVFKDGEPWGSAPVSTGRRGHDTPVGVFPILQKSVAHRSSLYNDAPMPYMQRLTWGGVALHGGNVSRYRASHGCIRLPHAFARRLYQITGYQSTAVLITRSPAASPATALALAGEPRLPATKPPAELAAKAAAPPSALPAAHGESIQLAAARSPEKAASLWNELVQRRPQLAQLQHQVIPARVNSVQFYRLRAFGPGAGAICRQAAREGLDCFPVAG